MPMTPDELERLVRAAFPDAEVVIEDLAGDGDHYRLTITSAAFRGKGRIEQHRMVYAALGPHMGGTLHALALVTRVPETAGEGSRP